jgi:hypothetical protein
MSDHRGVIGVTPTSAIGSGAILQVPEDLAGWRAYEEGLTHEDLRDGRITFGNYDHTLTNSGATSAEVSTAVHYAAANPSISVHYTNGGTWDSSRTDYPTDWATSSPLPGEHN